MSTIINKKKWKKNSSGLFFCLLRFSNPILKEVAGNYLSAKKEGSGCTQMTRFGEKKVIGNEDCLFLNIYTPMVNNFVYFWMFIILTKIIAK